MNNKLYIAKLIDFFYQRVDNLLSKGKCRSLHKVENKMRKVENAGYQHFLLFSQCFLSKGNHDEGLLKLIYFAMTIGDSGIMTIGRRLMTSDLNPTKQWSLCVDDKEFQFESLSNRGWE